MEDKLIVALAGMPGAGKSVFVRVARQTGYSVVVMGDVVREEVKRRGLKPTSKNIGKVMIEMRQNEGPSIVARKCLSKIRQKTRNKLVIDGIRSLHEVEEFRKHFAKVSLVAIHSSPETRFKRLFRRHRSDDPRNWKVFSERDFRELEVGLGNAIAMAESTIINERGIGTLKQQVTEVLRRIEKNWKTQKSL